MIHPIALAMAISIPAASQDAPEKLISQQGVELRNDERVFVLYAALNALGYSEETRRKGPPLKAPIFHPIREEVRDALRKVGNQPSLGAVRSLFEGQPAELESYLEAILAPEEGASGLSKETKAIQAKIGVLDDFREQGQLWQMFDTIADEQRALSKGLKTVVERNFGEAGRILGLAEIRSPQNLIVVPNPLDGHDVVRSVVVGTEHYLVVGPGLETAGEAILRASLRPVMRAMVDEAFGSAGSKFSKAWPSAASGRIARQFSDAKNYWAESLARALVHRVRSNIKGKPSKDADEDFLDSEAKDGMRWARSALAVVDEHRAGSSFRDALPKLMSKANP